MHYWVYTWGYSVLKPAFHHRSRRWKKRYYSDPEAVEEAEELTGLLGLRLEVYESCVAFRPFNSLRSALRFADRFETYRIARVF